MEIQKQIRKFEKNLHEQAKEERDDSIMKTM